MTRATLTILALVLVLAVLFATPALANNDPFVPADNCSGNPKVVGQPFGPNAVDNIELVNGVGDNPVDGAASIGNPGASTGAKGQANSQAIANCNP